MQEHNGARSPLLELMLEVLDRTDPLRMDLVLLDRVVVGTLRRLDLRLVQLGVGSRVLWRFL